MTTHDLTGDMANGMSFVIKRVVININAHQTDISDYASGQCYLRVPQMQHVSLHVTSHFSTGLRDNPGYKVLLAHPVCLITQTEITPTE